MGKKKLTIIDDSQPQEEKKQKSSKKNGGEAQLGAESNNSEQATEVTSGADSQLSEPASAGELENQTQTNEEAKPKKAQKPGKTHGSSSKKVRSKKYQGKVADLDKTKSYPILEAVELVKKLSYSKFDGTLEAHINTAQTGLRGLVSLPFASGKKLRILAFGSSASFDSAQDRSPGVNSDDVILGDDSTIEEINKGKVNFDLVVTTPVWMPKLAKIARILGPRGLMPNPKNGTITDDLKKAVEGFMSGKTEYKTEAKAPVIHLALGKLNQPSEELTANIKMLMQTLGKTRVKKVTLSPTMGPSVKVDLGSI